MQLLSARTKERPLYFDFTKQDIVGNHPSLPALSYDPFPEFKNTDVVRREIVGRELVLYAKIRGPHDCLQQGMRLDFGGRAFLLTEFAAAVDTKGDETLFEVEGSCHLQTTPPMDVLKRLRGVLSAGQ
jgi:hypothetical protein